MNAHKASLINAILLVTLSLWGYFSSETPSITALIPAFVGVILIAINKGVKKENKVIAHIAVVLTLVILVGLIKPLLGAVDRSDNLAILRVLIMIISTIMAMIYFIKSFIQVRKNRLN
jgi:predicted ferric reductase